MRTNRVMATAVVALSVTAAVGAQSAKAMPQPSKSETTSMTYTGCVASFNHGAAFLLTKVDSRGAESMHGDTAMARHDESATKHDGMAKDGAATMSREQASMADDGMDAMPPKSFALAGSTNLSKHVGQRVSVTGSLSDGSTGMMRPDVSTLTIKTLKVMAKSCS